MLYILPPPRAPSPPSPWSSILCTGTAVSSPKTLDASSWAAKSNASSRARLRARLLRNEESSTGTTDDVDMGRNSKSLSECYFAGKGTALVLPATPEAQKSSRNSGAGSNIQKHLQSMFYLLRPEETLKMAVKLESVHPGRTRYLVVVSRMGIRAEESCLLGIDCNQRTTVGLVLKVLADTSITLDGDGGFSVSVCGSHHIFKPVSVQAMWSALQSLHKVSSKAREQNYFQGGVTHTWVQYYEERVASERSCLNEWHAMDDLESRRPPSPGSARTKPTRREDTERLIRATLKDIMMTVDLDEVTSKCIRTKLEEDLDMDLGEYKSFIDQEMIRILGQMDAPTEVFDHVYLGSEWNASNYEELQRNGVGHILNVTREIDNFFPGTFDYLNIRVYDDEKTDLLKFWDDTYKYISKAKNEGSKVLVHCKMGVSRSASVVIAYAMKAYNWDFKTAMQHVKDKRSCIKPNTSFVSQLETYQGILDAMKNKEKLQRSKSETNLKPAAKKVKCEPEPEEKVAGEQVAASGLELRSLGLRPKSWSPDDSLVEEIESPAAFRSLENLSQRISSRESLKLAKDKSLARNVLLPCDNGESYSVSPNQIMHITNISCDSEQTSVKDRVNELEQKKVDKKKLVLNLLPQFEQSDSCCNGGEAQSKQVPETCNSGTIDDCDLKCSASTDECKVGSTVPEVRLRTKVVRKDGDPFSNKLDRVFDREERKQQKVTDDVCDVVARNCPSRQSSWSSYDSAVVLGSCGAVPSRHSSWGSGDTRTLPSRNSSWGSYDIRPSANDLIESSSSGIFPYDKEDIPWYPGTVRRTKQRLENGGGSNEDKPLLVEAMNTVLIRDVRQRKEPTKSVNISSAITDFEIADKEISSRLSASAPESSTMERVPQESCSLSRSDSNISKLASQSPSVKKHKTFLENLHKNNKKDETLDIETSSGLVQNLKKEFEAKNLNERKNQMNLNNADNTYNRVNSLPSSPTSDKALHSPTASDPGEDLNFKELIGKFENSVVTRPKTNQQLKNARYSCIVSVEKSPIRIVQTSFISNYSKSAAPEKSVETEFKRPPLSPGMRSPNPNVLVTTVIAKAAKKQQQFGKSHPLARLNLKPRHNNPVYNTM